MRVFNYAARSSSRKKMKRAGEKRLNFSSELPDTITKSRFKVIYSPAPTLAAVGCPSIFQIIHVPHALIRIHRWCSLSPGFQYEFQCFLTFQTLSVAQPHSSVLSARPLYRYQFNYLEFFRSSLLSPPLTSASFVWIWNFFILYRSVRSIKFRSPRFESSSLNSTQ